MGCQELQTMLFNDFNPLGVQLKNLKTAYKSCIPIGLKNRYTYNELDKYETLTLEFKKVSNMLMNKLLPLVDRVNKMDDGRIYNRLQRAYENDLIEHLDTFMDIIQVHSDIETEFMPDAMNRIYENVIDYVPFILVSIERVRSYSRQYLA